MRWKSSLRLFFPPKPSKNLLKTFTEIFAVFLWLRFVVSGSNNKACEPEERAVFFDHCAPSHASSDCLQTDKSRIRDQNAEVSQGSFSLSTSAHLLFFAHFCMCTLSHYANTQSCIYLNSSFWNEKWMKDSSVACHHCVVIRMASRFCNTKTLLFGQHWMW